MQFLIAAIRLCGNEGQSALKLSTDEFEGDSFLAADDVARSRERAPSAYVESSNAWMAKPSATEVNSWPARIGVSPPNLFAKSLRITGTKDEPPVMKMASTSRGTT